MRCMGNKLSKTYDMEFDIHMNFDIPSDILNNANNAKS